MTAIFRHAQRVEDQADERAEAWGDFDALFLAHYDRVYGILYRLVGTRDEAEDLAQDVFLKLYQQPAVQQGNVGAWLYRVATNHGYNAIRSRKRRWQWQRWLVQRDNAPSAETLLDQAEEQAAVRATLAQLKPQQAQLLLLRHIGLSYAEIAASCQINVNSVGKQLARASQAFRTMYILTTKERHHA